MRDHGVLGDDDDAVADEVALVVEVFRLAGGGDDHVVPDAGVLVDDGVLDFAMGADAHAGLALALRALHGFLGLVIVAAENDDAVQFRAVADDGAQADNGVADPGAVDDAAVRNHGVVHLGAVDLGAGQIAGPGEDGRAHVEEIEARQLGDEVEVRLEEVPDGSDVLPIALIDIGENPVGGDGLRDDVLAEVGQVVVQQVANDVAVENIDAHGGQVGLAAVGDGELRVHLGRDLQRIEDGGICRLFHKAGDPLLVVNLHDAEGTGLVARHRQGGDGDVRARFAVLFDDLLEIHPVQLVAAQNQEVIEIVVEEVDQVFADGIGRALVPRGGGGGLLRGHDFHEAGGKLVELVRPRNVAVERGGIELGQDVDAAEPGIDAVGNRDVDNPVFAGQRHGRFGAVLGQGEESAPLPATHDDAENLADVERLAARL